MPARGKFIALEGIDGSGKRTQLEMIARAFSSRGIAFTQVSFPRYDGFFGQLVARFLYAEDRRESRPALESDLATGKTLLADRYIASNLAHQGARVSQEKRKEFLAWLKELEYRAYALPNEDLVVYLRVPAEEAHRLVGQKSKRQYTELRRDLQESDLAHLQAASEVYDELARQANWVKIECYDAQAQAMRAPEEIHKEILAAIEARVFPALHASR